MRPGVEDPVLTDPEGDDFALTFPGVDGLFIVFIGLIEILFKGCC